jgi:hypothetical protein
MHSDNSNLLPIDITANGAMPLQRQMCLPAELV